MGIPAGDTTLEYEQVLGHLTTITHISGKCAQSEYVYVCCDSKDVQPSIKCSIVYNKTMVCRIMCATVGTNGQS
jgi:hypothetical protein